MSSRRRFLVEAPVGFAGVLAACRDANGTAASVTQAGAVQPTPSGSPRPLLASVPANATVLKWTPKHEELVYTFGGATPRQRIKPGTRIVSWTEDCFDGAVKTAADLPSKVMPAGHDNPQSGPFYIEGAEPG